MFVVEHVNLADADTRDLIAAFAIPRDHDAVSRYASTQRRLQGLAARALLRLMLERHAACAAESWLITHDPQGKPVVRRQDDGPLINVSIAHSHAVAACAISDQGDIGIDVEYLGRTRAIHEIAASAFGERERRLVTAGGPAAFYRIWTLREALAKALGRGLPMVVDQTDYFDTAPTASDCRSHLLGRMAQASYRQISDHYGMAVVFLPRVQDPTGTPHRLREQSSADFDRRL